MQPQAEAKEGSTRSFANYSAETSELVKFRENLTSFDGGHKSVPDARQISSDIHVGKYFAHVDKSKIKWNSLFDQDSLKSYVDKLVDAKIGPAMNEHDIISIFIGKKVALTITKKY